MADELKPCPFCGQSDIRIITHNELHEDDEWVDDGFYGICDAMYGHPGCGASTGWHKTQAEAQEAWNTRALLSQEAKPVAQPVAWLHKDHQTAHVITDRVKSIWTQVDPKHVENYTIPLFDAAPDEEHRIEAFEEAAKYCDAQAASIRRSPAYQYSEYLKAAANEAESNAIAIRALADRERG